MLKCFFNIYPVVGKMSCSFSVLAAVHYSVIQICTDMMCWRKTNSWQMFRVFTMRHLGKCPKVQWFGVTVKTPQLVSSWKCFGSFDYIWLSQNLIKGMVDCNISVLEAFQSLTRPKLVDIVTASAWILDHYSCGLLTRKPLSASWGMFVAGRQNLSSAILPT